MSVPVNLIVDWQRGASMRGCGCLRHLFCEVLAGQQPQLFRRYFCAGLKPADLESPNPVSALQFLINPSAQIQELQQALTALSGQTANSQVGPSLLTFVSACQ